MNDYFTATEIAVMAGISESAVRAAIKRGDFPQPLFRHRGRHMWTGHVVSTNLEKLKLPHPLADRRATIPQSCESR